MVGRRSMDSNRQCGVISSTMATDGYRDIKTVVLTTKMENSCAGDVKRDRHFIPSTELSSSENRLIRLPRDSTKHDHCYVRQERAGLCVKCHENLAVHSPPVALTSIDPTMCHSQLLSFRDGLFANNSMPGVEHLRELVTLQAELLISQQEKLYNNERSIEALLREKGQLESRIERMERRMTVLQKTQPSPAPFTPKNRCSQTFPASPTPTASLRRPTIPSPTSDPTTPLHSSPSHQSPSEAPTLDLPFKKRKLEKQFNQLFEDTMLNSDETQTKECQVFMKDPPSALFFEDVPMAITPQEEEDKFPNMEVDSCSTTTSEKDIETPSWRIRYIKPSLNHIANMQQAEDLSDEGYSRRHRKLEENERRRKRWDQQRAREQMNHEYLMKRYKKIHEKGVVTRQDVSQKRQKEVLWPPKKEVERIEVCEKLPVSAFGHIVPVVESNTFDIPWFDHASWRLTRGRLNKS